jgi:hypothetical protein
MILAILAAGLAVAGPAGAAVPFPYSKGAQPTVQLGNKFAAPSNAHRGS